MAHPSPNQPSHWGRPLPGASALDTADLRRSIQLIFSSASYRPPTLPAVALELMELAQKPSTEVKQVVALLETDALLSARVLKVANSALYASRSPLLTLRDAVMRLGIGNVRDLVLEAALHMRVFQSGGYGDAMERLRLHSMCTAHLVRLICRSTSLDVDYAFLCGLFHDFGAIATLLALADVPSRNAPPPLDKLWPALEPIHEETGVLVLKLWKMPEAIEQFTAQHHARGAGPMPPLVAALCVAELLSEELGFGLSGPWEPAPTRSLAEATDTLRLNRAQVMLLRQSAESLGEMLGG